MTSNHPPDRGDHGGATYSAEGHDFARVYQAQRDIVIGGGTVESPPIATVRRLPGLSDGKADLFVGREAEIDLLRTALGPDPHRQLATTVVSAVAGMGGIGKTALACHVARMAVDQEWFPAGAFLADLHGYDTQVSRRVLAHHLVGPLLRAIGVVTLDPTPAGQFAQFHRQLGRLAVHNRAVLLVLDNVSDQEQIEALLPVERLHRVLITTREPLNAVVAEQNLRLGLLDEQTSVQLVSATMAKAWRADPRIHAEPTALRELVRLCDMLPLALRIVAGILVAERDLTVADMVDELRDGATRLDVLTDGVRAVRTAFDLSWDRLPLEQARLLALVALNPGPDFALDTAIALADRPRQQTQSALRALVGAHLLERTGNRRWRVHDLIRLHSAEKLRDHEDGIGDERQRALAITRMLQHYLSQADAAAAAFDGSAAASARFPDREVAGRWLDEERGNLLASVILALPTHPEVALHLPLRLARYLHRQRHFDDMITVHQTAVLAARRLGDRRSEGTALNNLGTGLQEARRFEEAVVAHRQDLAICRQTGDRHAQGTALNNLGIALQETRRFHEAVTAHREDLVICRETGDRDAEGVALSNLGIALQETGRLSEALEFHRSAVDLYRELDDPAGHAAALNNLGIALQESERFDDAVEAHRAAGSLYRQVGDRPSESLALSNLGLCLRKLSRSAEAVVAHRQDLVICRETGDRHAEGIALSNLGIALQEIEELGEAVSAHQAAVDLYRRITDRHGQAVAQNNLGVALRQLRRMEADPARYRPPTIDIGPATSIDELPETSEYSDDEVHVHSMPAATDAETSQSARAAAVIEAHRQAAILFNESEDRHGEGIAWNNLGLALQETDQFIEAANAHQTAAGLFEQTGDLPGQGLAFQHLGTALAAAGRQSQALSAWQSALLVYVECADQARIESVRLLLADADNSPPPAAG
ncbi:tetratricopeptide repeat protein [Actinoalloteichus hymeniacidonis]|uniref:NB-ARC domain-containing protein n=1 Tax=Actinoalloteichus hymeniacidonis TaxID=340345 RepID=A0AAC9HL92_9PSEU|nr:tetratricopeptide repeat protein [Actinoalloteichus hymeniacidonis]AOS61467.1 NB-ARC domain-containing protein [Actinoalloteichus hymeniacidonis]MBB5910526.1 tetratricopeptide (TPR) repeat protein [Actinoalloteichus hymeniacidonis]